MVEKKDIESLIVEHKKSSLKNHWSDSFFINTAKYSGEVRKNEILLWSSGLFLRAAYPIFHIIFDQNDQMVGVQLEKNPFHKLLNKLLIGLVSLIIALLFTSSEISFAIKATCGTLLIVFVLRMVFSRSRKFEIKLLTDELKQTIEQIEQQNNPELSNNLKSSTKEIKTKEWTLGKILTRLFLYPFCGLIVYWSITGLIPEGKVVLGIGGVIIGLGYIIIDLILALRIKPVGINK